MKDRKSKYGEGPAPPGWPTPLDWSSFRGPGKHSSDMCIEIIVGLKHERNKEAATEEFVEEEDGEVEEGEVVEGVQEEIYQREVSEDQTDEDPVEDELPEIHLEGEPVTQNVRKSSLNKKKTSLKVDKQPTRATSKRTIRKPKRFMDAAEEEEEEERAPKRVKSITSHVKTQLQRFQEENETVPILIQQQKNKASFLADFEEIFSSSMD